MATVTIDVHRLQFEYGEGEGGRLRRRETPFKRVYIWNNVCRLLCTAEERYIAYFAILNTLH